MTTTLEPTTEAAEEAISDTTLTPERLSAAYHAVEAVGDYLVELLQATEALDNYMHFGAANVDSGESILDLVIALGKRIRQDAERRGIVERRGDPEHLVPGRWCGHAQDGLLTLEQQYRGAKGSAT